MRKLSLALLLLTLLILSALSAEIAFATTQTDCAEINVERLRLSFAGRNLAYAETTRTPQGGPYLPIIVEDCSEGACRVRREMRTIMRYAPRHPDANARGFVRFPDIHVPSESESFNKAAANLKAMAGKNTCGAKIMDYETSALIHYRASDVRTDVFNFGPNGKVVSWQRTTTNGRSMLVNFNDEGKAISSQMR